tara:strand:- start:1643 stop:2203 length:561 start_codon:yes stop_codon:yes gene_type:complete
MYYGEELGLVDCAVAPGMEQDPWGKNCPELNRNRCRSPMQWSLESGLGFTQPDATPWLPFADPTTSMASQIVDPRSTLSLCRALLDLRRRHLELTVGDLAVLEEDSDNVLSFARSLDGQSTYVAINFTDQEQSYTFPIAVGQLLGTEMARSGTFGRITLDPNEVVIAAQTIGGSSIHNSKLTERRR